MPISILAKRFQQVIPRKALKSGNMRIRICRDKARNACSSTMVLLRHPGGTGPLKSVAEEVGRPVDVTLNFVEQ